MTQATLRRPATQRRARATRLIPDRHGSVQDVLLETLRSEGATSGLQQRLRRYAPFLAAEFDEEEGPGGALGEVLEQAPRFAARVEACRREHSEILGRLRELVRHLERESPDSERTWWLRRALYDALRRHRRRENDLVLDAHYLDLGGEG